MTRDFQLPGRSLVLAEEALVATSHPLATAAGLDLLRRGGNAVDAAIAASAVLGVVEPGMAGIGGDSFALVHLAANGRVAAVDGAGWAPRGASARRLAEAGFTTMPTAGPHAVTGPGAVDCWARLAAELGRMPLAASLEAAIHYAERGHPVHERVAADWSRAAAKLAADPDSAAIFLPDGTAPAAGTRFRQPRLAATLRRIASQGRSGFYEGPVAADILRKLRMLGGWHDEEDFAAYRSRVVAPLSTEHRGLAVHQCPPPGQGVVTLALLRILAALGDLPDDPLAAERIHLLAEAGRIAYADRDAALGDVAPARAIHLFDEARAAAAAARIDRRRAAGTAVDATPGDTSYVAVVDRDRNAASLISSLFQSFGSGLTAGESGVVLQDRGAAFSLAAGHPSEIAPRRRPPHTIMPGLATRDGEAAFVLGMVGGHYQPFGQAWLLENALRYGLDAQRAVDLPRAFAYGGEIQLESGVPDSTAAALVAMGHRVTRPSLPLGSAQMIAVDPRTGILSAGSDGRSDGCALGY
jgi:gamma-glutamyltranspeptidase/glutathione hydrolase